MPLPFILGAAGAAIAGAVGIGGHLSAKETNEKAQKRSNEAQRIYNEEKSVLEKAQNVTKESLLKLGYDKKQVLEVDLKNFFDDPAPAGRGRRPAVRRRGWRSGPR